MNKGPKNLEHIKYILENLRDKDKKELQVIYQDDYINKAYKNIEDKDVTIVYDEETPVLMYGVHSPEDNIGIVWMLSTSMIEKDLIWFLREGKREVNEWSKQFKVLCNLIYKENSHAINWLKWLGFKFNYYTDDFMFFYKET